MAKILPWILLSVLLAALTMISFFQPHLLNDNNKSLASFINHDLLSVLGFVIAVTLASATSVHFELNRLEVSSGKTFDRTRSSLKRSAYSLIFLFGFATVIVVFKPLLPERPFYGAMANSLAIGVIFFNLSVMLDLTRTVFKIPAVRPIVQQNCRDAD